MQFPFEKGETFLENEIDYLASSFKEVIIFALSVSESKKRKIPENVTAIAVNNKDSKYRYLYYGFQGIFFRGILKRRQIWPIPTSKALLAAFYARGRVNSSYIKIIKVLDQIIFKVKPEYSVFYSYWFMDQAIIACLLRSRYRKNMETKVVSRAHGYDLYDYRNKANFIPFREMVLNSIDKVFSCSLDGGNYLIEKFPKWKSKIETAYLGTKDYGIQNSLNKKPSFHIVSCSNLISLKRVHLIAESLALLYKQGIKNFHWTCIGDGPEKQTIIKIIEKNDLDKRVSLLGQLTNIEVMKFYQHQYCDLFINVSIAEGLPVSIMEAQSFGIPILATDVGGTREIVNNQCGIIIPPNIVCEELTRYFYKFFSFSEKKLFEFRSNSRKHWEQHFNAANNYIDWNKKLND